MFKFVKVLGVVLFLFSVVSFAFAQSEKITITTYYPSPYGVYNEMRLYPHTPFTTPCDAANAGTMWFDSSDNTLKICNGTSYQAAGWWKSSNGVDIANANSGYVQIRTRDPLASNRTAQVTVVPQAVVISQSAPNHNDPSPEWSTGVSYIDGAFNFGKNRAYDLGANSADIGPTKRHPWVVFEPTWYSDSFGEPREYSPDFLLFPPVGKRQVSIAAASRDSCETLCRKKFVTSGNPNDNYGVFCLAATGANDAPVVGGIATNNQVKISCSDKYAQINCLCAELNLFNNGNF